jgi:hypothetical protein
MCKSSMKQTGLKKIDILILFSKIENILQTIFELPQLSKVLVVSFLRLFSYKLLLSNGSTLIYIVIQYHFPSV